MSQGSLDKAIPRALGITCASCHLTPEEKIRGPYQVDAPHDTVVEPRSQTSAACALCHAAGERVIGKQTQTSLEWLDDYSKAGLGSKQCQDCHMPRTMRKLAEDYPGPERLVARHTWPGGHSFKQIAGALELAVAQPKPGQPQFSLRVVNVGAGKEWMFAPWMLGRPDDKAFVAEDLKGPDPIAMSQADAQGPHETIIRAGETRMLDWRPGLPPGRYTVKAALVYDLNRYNDRAFKEDQTEIGHASFQAVVTGAGNPR